MSEIERLWNERKYSIPSRKALSVTAIGVVPYRDGTNRIVAARSDGKIFVEQSYGNFRSISEQGNGPISIPGTISGMFQKQLREEQKKRIEDMGGAISFRERVIPYSGRRGEQDIGNSYRQAVAHIRERVEVELDAYHRSDRHLDRRLWRIVRSELRYLRRRTRRYSVPMLRESRQRIVNVMFDEENEFESIRSAWDCLFGKPGYMRTRFRRTYNLSIWIKGNSVTVFIAITAIATVARLVLYLLDVTNG